MTDRTQFEAMLEALINEDQETAKEIFHNIVVAKSREIYEEMLAEDFSINEAEEEEEEEEESKDDDSSENPFGGDEEGADDEEGEEDGEDEFGSEEGEEDEFGGEEGEGDLEDRVLDLEDALDELKAEFEELMAQEEGEGHDELGGEEPGMDMGGEEPGMDIGGEEGEGEDELSQFMEYVDKVALPKHGDNGVQTRSPHAKPNRMGGANLMAGNREASGNGGTQGGLLKPTTQKQDAGNVNVPGAKSATKLSNVSKGHGAEKKGAGEHADNKKSIVGSRK